MPDGYLCLVLHAHLPFVRHPEHEDFFEEDWLYEAITETYIPLLEVFERLQRDGVDFRITLSLSPPLVAMLDDPLLQQRYVRHIDNLIELAAKEIHRTRWQPCFQRLAQMYHQRFVRAREVFVGQYGSHLLNGFRRLWESGKVEITTCAATHGLLPLITVNPNAAYAQIELACREHERHFGRRPAGIWLPECAYSEGLDAVLARCGLQYFFMDTHGVLFAEPRPRFGVYAPILCPQSRVAAVGRDTESSKQVWSSVEGYPGDYNYREFYRDIGFDLDYEYLRPHLHSWGDRHNLGIKYYKITGPTNHKEPYDPDRAIDKAAEHAGNFMFNRERQVEYLHSVMGREPIVVAPYDAELFGHWWFEGPEWIEFLLRKICYDQDTLKTITVPEYLARYQRHQRSQPVFSTWGWKGYCEVWLNGSNDWIYRHLHESASRMVELSRTNSNPDPLRRRALNQAARELLLAQSSDWAFIMHSGTVVDYAISRTRDHLLNFQNLCDQLSDSQIDESWLTRLEQRNNIFPTMDYRVYA